MQAMSNPPPESNGTASVDASKPVYDESQRIVILTPCFDRQATTDYQESLFLCRQLPSARFRMADGSVQILPIVADNIWFSNESHIDRARNSLSYEAEKKHYRYVLWWDGDQPAQPEDIAKIWTHLINGVRIVTGLVALKSIVPTFVCNTLKGERVDPKTGLMKIKDGGTGFMAFNRDVFVELRERWPQYVRARLAEAIGFSENSPLVERAVEAMAKCGLSADISFTGNANTVCAGKTAYAYFASGVTMREGRGDWLSEDWMLCHRLTLLGIPIYADVTINLRHLGRQLFPPPPEEIIEAALKVTSGRNPPFNKGLSQAAAEVLSALQADINDKSISVLHATRGRPEQAIKIREMFIKRAGAPIEYIFGLDSDDAQSIAALSKYPHVIVKGGHGIVQAINAAAEKATGRILVMAADDCHPPENWAIDVRAAFADQLHEPVVLATSDGYSDQMLIPHPIMTRAFYQAQGYFYCPEYPHLFCDTELTVRAAEAGQIIDARHLVFKHEHPMFTGAPPDKMALERNSKEAWEVGKAIFKKRNPNANHPHAK